MTGPIALAGKHVLFIAPRFFGYDNDIAEEMRRRGATVTRLFDRPFSTPAMTAVTKLAPGAVARTALPGYRATIAGATAPFDLVFVVNGQTVPGTLLGEIRRHSPRATFILYLWDALRNRGSIIPNLDRYDQVFGFDREDARAFGFRYRPLFFAPVFDRPGTTAPHHDISFIGTAHTDRAPIVHAIDQGLSADVTRFWYLFLQAPWVRRYYALKNPAFRQVPAAMFRYAPLTKDQTGAVFQQSRTILDIEHPLQRGLTMRTFETLGAGKKLVTTNPHVVEEDFFRPANILVMDRRSPGISRDFLDQPFAPLPAAMRARYALAGWMDEILADGGGADNRPAGE